MVHAHQRTTPQDNLFGDQKFWRTKFLDAYKKHLPFKSLDSFVGNPSVNFQRILKHPMADAYYDAMLPTPEQFQKIALPILTITGQYDGDELGALTYYRDHLANASSQARAKHFLIIGPWDHAGTRTPTDEVAGVKFGPGAIVDLNDLHRQWYDWTMKAGPKPAFLKNQVAYYLLAPGNSGANGEWKYADKFETLTANPKTFYLDSKNGDANGVFRSGVAERKAAERWHGCFCLRSAGHTARRKRGGNRSKRKNRRTRSDVCIEYRQRRIGLSHRSATERNPAGRVPGVKSMAIHRYARCRS